MAETPPVTPPTPAEPIVELIAKNLKTTLEAVQYGNNWRLSISQVIRRTSLDSNYNPPDHSVTLYQLHAEPGSKPDAGYNRWRQFFQLDLVVMQSEKATTPLDTVLNLFRAEAERAVMADPQRGGYAEDTFLGGVIVSDNLVNGITVIVIVQYSVRANDPFTRT